MYPPNFTLIIEMLVFWLFIWITMKFIWPPLMNAIEERQAKIADGMAAAERGRKELDLAQHRVSEIKKQAKQQAFSIIENAHRCAAEIVDTAKCKAQSEAKISISDAYINLEKEINRATDSLNEQATELAIKGAEKILGRKLASNKLVNQQKADLKNGRQ